MENSEFESPELQAKLKACDPEVQQYLVALKAENLRLHKQVVKLEAKKISGNNRVLALEEQIEHHLKKHIDLPSMSHQEKEHLGHALAREVIKRAGGWDEFNKKYPDNS